MDFLWQVMRVVQLMTRLVTMKVGEESNPTNDDVSPVASEKNTVVSECMKDEYLEWPSCDFSASHDKAQLSAMQWICDWAQRQARAIANGYDCLAAWCSRQIELHRMYSRVGSITLN